MFSGCKATWNVRFTITRKISSGSSICFVRKARRSEMRVLKKCFSSRRQSFFLLFETKLYEDWKMKINLKVVSFFHCWLQQQQCESSAPLLCPKIPFLLCFVEKAKKNQTRFLFVDCQFWSRERERGGKLAYDWIEHANEAKGKNEQHKRASVYGKQEFNFAPQRSDVAKNAQRCTICLRGFPRCV